MTQHSQENQQDRSPRNVEAEAALIGAMLIDNRVIDTASEALSNGDFFEPLHGRIFDAICLLYDEGKTVTPVTLKPMFADDEALKALGGLGYLVKLTSNVAGIVGHKGFIEQISQLSKLRKIIAALNEGILRAQDTSAGIDPASITGFIDGELGGINDTVDAKYTKGFAEVWDEAIKRSQDEAMGDGSHGIALERFVDWTNTVGKMRPGEVTIGAGRPGMGKTGCALHVSASAALQGEGTAYILLESNSVSMIQRAMSGVVYTGPDSPTASKIQNWQLNSRERFAVEQARLKIENCPLIMSDPAVLYAERLQSHIRRLQNRMMRQYGTPLKLVVIDYLQKMKCMARGMSKTEQVSAISNAIAIAAKECDVHILALAQLSRAVEQRDDKRPIQADLRDSGEIEQDATNIVFFYRPIYYHDLAEPKGRDESALRSWQDWRSDAEAMKNDLHLICAKRRFGSPGSCVSRFFAEHQAVRSAPRFEGDEGEVLI